MVVQRGYRPPPSFHIDRLRDAPVGYVFDVITNGFGVMPDYAAQIDVADRWAIVAYVRALQLSQNAPTAAVAPADRARLEQAIPDGAPTTTPAPGPGSVADLALGAGVPMKAPADLSAAVLRARRPLLLAGIAGVIACAVGAFATPVQFFRSYLFACVFWSGLALGSLAILMLRYVTGGAWGVPIRRPLEAATRTLLLDALFLRAAFLRLEKSCMPGRARRTSRAIRCFITRPHT